VTNSMKFSPQQRNSLIDNRPPSVASSVYKEVIEHQQRSNQATLKGLEQVVSENEALKKQMAFLEKELLRVKQLNLQLQQSQLEHERVCPLRGSHH